MKTDIMNIQNLKCAGCVQSITNSLSKLEGISNVLVNHKFSNVNYTYTDDKTRELVKATLSKIGYPLVGEPNKLFTKTKSYISCAIGKASK